MMAAVEIRKRRGFPQPRGTQKQHNIYATPRVPHLKRNCETSRRTAYGYLATHGETQTRKQTGA